MLVSDYSSSGVMDVMLDLSTNTLKNHKRCILVFRCEPYSLRSGNIVLTFLI